MDQHLSIYELSQSHADIIMYVTMFRSNDINKTLSNCYWIYNVVGKFKLILGKIHLLDKFLKKKFNGKGDSENVYNVRLAIQNHVKETSKDL